MGGGEPSIEAAVGPNPTSLKTAGPFLRYQQSGAPGGGEARWTGSVLFLTSGGGAAPTLTLYGSGSSNGQQAQVAPAKLDEEEGWVFWRFDLALQLGACQRAVKYKVDAPGVEPGQGTHAGKEFTFWLPAVGQPMHWGYYSCNGFSSNISLDSPERKDPCYLWRDLLQLHSAFPMHALVGGGDQLYNDLVFSEIGSKALKAWGEQSSHKTKVEAEWSPAMQAESTHTYLFNYISSFSIKEVQHAFASIPQTMMWDDHDIWDGYGSYDPDVQNCPVFKGLFAVARRFYLLFQQHTTDAFNQKAKEFLTNDGSELHWMKFMGPQVVLLGIDMRSLRKKNRIMPPATYELLQRTVDALPAGPQHVVVLCGCPLVFPAIPMAEAILGGVSKLIQCSTFCKGLFKKTGLLDRFDQPEILDDLIDGWASDIHKEERLEFIHMLQHFSKTKSLRVTILSGDAHVGGVGRLYSRPKIKLLNEDPFYMPQIISSAIMNGPPGHSIVRMLVRSNTATNVDANTRQKMVRTFYPMHPRTDKLVNARNWCDVSMVAPPYSPPTVTTDPDFGGLRFSLRVENVKHGREHCEETYTVVVPRHPTAKKVLLTTGTLTQGESAAAEAPAAVQPGQGVPLSFATALELPAQTPVKS